MEKYFDIKGQDCVVKCKLYCTDIRTAKKAVIYGTGFAGHKDNNAAMHFAEKLLSKVKNTAVVVFNWPAHGDDVKKKLVLEDCGHYLELVIREMEGRFGIQELYGYATSFGGYLFLKYISEHGNPFRKTVLRCPAVDMYDVLTRAIMKNDEFDKIRKGKEALVGFDRKIVVVPELLEDLKANDIRQRSFLDEADNLMIIHGTADEVVPFESAESFAEDNVIDFIPVEGADHRFRNPVHMSLANKTAAEFFGLQ